ncbi:MAG: InlB B-repeat-containing protein [Candidatus Faecousia sp.]|nr:InlB B-repeat-containing protein [Candidatus Faecousia sp.]
MKSYFRRIISMILVIATIANISLTGFAETTGGEQRSSGDVFSFAKEVTWAEAAKQIAGMLSFIVEDAANIDLTAYSERIEDLSLEDDSVYLAILAENGYLPEEAQRIDPEAAITADEYVQLMEIAFPTVVDSQGAIDSLRGESKPGNIAILGDGLSVSTMLPERLAVATAQRLTLTAVKATALSLNAKSSVDLSECEITRVHIHDTAVKEEEEPEEEAEPDVIYLHMDSGTQLPEVIVKGADQVVIEGSGALGVVRVQEAVGSLTVRATGSVVNETEEPFEVTGPDAEVVELQPGEQVDFVLSKWLVSFVTEGTPVETQEIAPGGMIDFSEAVTTLEGKLFTAWYEDAEYTTPVSRLASVDRQTTLYARFVDESEAAVITFETFGGRELEPMVFAKGEYLLTKPVESLYTSKEGYSFVGWCVDEECTTGFGYTDPIEQSMTLYAMYASYEKQTQEDPGSIAELELPDAEATIGLVLPEGMSADEAKQSITVEAGTGLEIPEIAVRETESGAELYCEKGFTPGTSFTLYVQNGVRFAGYPEYIDTLTVSVFREQVEVVEFAEGLTYVLWDKVTDYTPVSKTAVEYKTDYSLDGTVHDVLEDHAAEGDVIPGKMTITGEVDFQPEQIVVFYDGEINRDEATIDAWEGGDLAGYVLFAKIEAVEDNKDGTSEVTFSYADPETYISEMDVHTSEEVNIEELMDDEQIAQVEKAIASQLTSNDELKAQMMVAVMTNEETQRMLDEKYGANTYSLASLIPIPTDPKLDIKLSIDGSTATAGIGVGITIYLKSPQGILATITPYLYFEEQLTLDVNVDGGFLWLDMAVLFNTKTTVSLQIKATTGDGMDNVLDEAKTTLQKIVNADGTASEDVDYQEAADTLMNTMQELIGAELEYQDLFAVPLFKYKYPFYGIITLGINIDLVGQAGVVATFGVTVVAEYGQKIGFNYNFLKFKGGSYKEKLGSEVTTEIYLIGKIGIRVGIAITLSVKLLQNVTVSITGAVYAYVDLAGMFMYVYALSAGGGNYAGALYLEVGIDAEIELALEVEVLFISKEFNWTLWSARWPLYKKSIGMTMSVVQSDELNEIWEQNMEDANANTTFPFPYLPMKSYDMLTAVCTENQLLFENLKDGKITAELTLENIVLNGEPVSSDDPRTSVMYVGDGVNGRCGVVYADEMAAAAYKVTDYECDVVLTYHNSNKSELIKNHRQVFHFAREFKMATTTVNVDIRLYDWCAHAWGIEGAEWDNDVVYAGKFESTHVLGCPVKPTATGTIDLNAVMDAVREQYPEIDGAALSWFSPTLNQVNRTVQYSTPRISSMCYMTPESNTIRYDVFSTTNEYNLTYNLFASRYPGYSGEITYIIESEQELNDAVFTLRGSDQGETLTFTPMMGGIDLPTPTAAASMGSTASNKPGMTTGNMGITDTAAPGTQTAEQNSAGDTTKYRWMLTTKRSLFNGSERAIMMSLNGGMAVASGLMVTGREAESVVILSLGNLSKVLTVATGEGIKSWSCVSPDASQLSAITPGSTVTLSAVLKDGYKSLRLTSEPEGLQYTIDGSTVTFTMPSYDVKVTLRGVRSYQANFLYNYDKLGTYQSFDVVQGDTIQKPANPYVKGLTFAGWYDNAECKGEAYDFSQQVTGNVTLYADWRVNVTVDFGGAMGQARYVENGVSKPIFSGDDKEYRRFTYTTHKLGDTALEYRLPEYNGYDFMGWYLTSDFSGDPVDPAEYKLTGGVTFYARWKQIAVLTYELNYGQQEEPYDMAMEYVGMPLSHIPVEPQRKNYQFLGWFRTQDANPANLIDLDSYLPEGSMTLYAGWKPVEYTITYKLGGGENDPANPVSYNIESGEIVLLDPTRKGYTFLGWTAAGEGLSGSVDRIPAGSTGSVTLTAAWEVNTYTISYTLGGGNVDGENPDSYTVEDAEITLINPSRSGYTFLGWTGTDLTEATRNVVIPTGSTGNRSYTANWSSNVATEDIVQAALDAIQDPYTMSVNDFESIQDVKTLAVEDISKDPICADYLDQLSVTVAQVGEAKEDGTGYSYTAKVTVSFTDDSGNPITRNKNVALRVEKNPVTISAEVVYSIGGKYVAYGTVLQDVELTNNAAVSGGRNVAGQFQWADGTIVPVAADNGKLLYKLRFTPTDTANYCTAEMLMVVNTQIGVQIAMDAPTTIAYTGGNLGLSDVGFYAVNKDTGEKLEGVSLDLAGAVLEQSQFTPGKATVTLKSFDSCQLLGVSDTNLYAIVGRDVSAEVTINRAKPIISGTTGYSTDYGKQLKDISLELYAATVAEDSVEGNFAWENPNTRLGEVGVFSYKVTFTPKDLNCYESVSLDVKVTVNGVPGKVTYILQAPDAPADSQFTISGAMEAMSFAPVEGKTNEWSVTVNRAAFAENSECPILLKRSGSTAIETGLTVTGREADDQVILTLDNIPRKLSVTYTDGLDGWQLLKPENLDMNTIAPGTEITISANLLEGFNNLRLSSDPEGLSYTSYGETLTFTMPANDVDIELRGVKNYLLNCLYNYNDMGIYCNVESAEDGSVTNPADPTIDGLTFAGWYDNPDFTGEPFDFSQKITGNIDLYADWRVNVTVDFGGQKGVAAYYPKETGGEWVPPEVVDPGDGLGGDYTLIFPGDSTEKERFTYSTQRVGDTMLNLVIPQPEDYGFFGWYLTADYSDEEVNLYGYELTESVTFYAKWKKFAKLNYMWNDGTEDQWDEVVEYVGDLAQRAPSDPAWDGYEFTGWYRTPACQEKDRIDLATYQVEGDLTLYAGWKLVDYTISYTLNGGVNDSRNPESYTIVDEKTDIYQPTREGYAFDGWDYSDEDPVACNDAFDYWIPAGSIGNVSLSARWVPIKYFISYELNGGTVTTENPEDYNIESAKITLNNPTRKGYTFLGWTGDGLENPTTDVTIPAGSIGNRSYTANWQIKTSVADIVKAAKNAISDTLTYSFKADFDNNLNVGPAEFAPKIQEILSGNATCADYVGDQLTVLVVQNGEKKEDGTGYTYNTTVTVTFTDDNGDVTSQNKTVNIRLTKAAVNISIAEPVCTVDGKYIKYGTSLKDVKLSDDCEARGPEDELVAGSFTWADETIVPKVADNGTAKYKVLFTPDAERGWASYYSTAETMIVVNTQFGVKLGIDAPDSVEYMGRGLKPDECSFYVVDQDTGEKLESAAVSCTSVVLDQTSIVPGTATITPKSFNGLNITGISGNSLYALDSTYTGDTFTITRATVSITGETAYNALVGTSLTDITLNLKASTKYENSVSGNFSFDTNDTTLNTVGTKSYDVKFTPENVNCYSVPSAKSVTVTVAKKEVAVPKINPVVYDGKSHAPNVSATDDYTVTGNGAQTNAGNYTVTLTLKDTNKCKWADGDENATKTLTFTIQKANLTVTGTASVKELAYGQKLKAGHETSSEKKYQTTATEMISGLTIKDASGSNVTGYWEWDDENYVDKTLGASKKGVSGDNGEGYEVNAKFTATNASYSQNYNELSKSFHVDISRVTPTADSSMFKVKEGAIYMPKDAREGLAQPVNPLNDFTPAFSGSARPYCPNDTSLTVDGTLSWEDGSRKPKYSETTATAVFTPSEGYSKNYTTANVEVPLEYKEYMTVKIICDHYLLFNMLYQSEANTVTANWAPDYAWENVNFFSMKVSGGAENICVYRATVYDSKGNVVLQTEFPQYDPATFQPNRYGNIIGPQNPPLLLKTVPHGTRTDVIGNMVTFPPDTTGNNYIWNRTDVTIKIILGTMSSLDGEVYPSFGVYSTRAAAPTMLMAAEPTTEPTEPTTEATEPAEIPEPGEIGSVVSIRPKQEAEQYGDFWVIPLEQDQELVEFQWETSEPASKYYLYTMDEFGNLEFYAETTETSAMLFAEDYEGSNTLYVGAVLEDGSVTWGEAMFQLIPFEEATEETTEPTEETTEPTEETTEPTQETTEPTEETTEPTQETTEPTQETTEPTEKSTQKQPTEPTTESIPEPTFASAPAPEESTPGTQPAKEAA